MRPTRLAALGLTMLLIASAAACGGDDGDGGYSDSVRSGYMEGCLEGGNQAFCDCTLREFEENYSQEEFERLALGFTDSADPPEEFLEVIATCVGELGSGG